MPFGSLWRLCSWNRDSALAVAATTSSQQHFSYHSCVHRWERREKKKIQAKVWNRFFTGSLKVWCFVADAVFAAPGKVNPERRISLTKAACLRGWGIILQRVTWIDLEGEGSVTRKGSKYAAGGPRTVKTEVDLIGRLVLSAGMSLGDNDGGLRLSSRHHTHKRRLWSGLDNITAAAACCSEWTTTNI